VQSLFDHGILVRTGSNGATTIDLTRPVTEIEIPPTVQAVLAARIDRLGEREKAVLQIAAVVGKEFAEPVLRRVVATQSTIAVSAAELTAALHTLTAAELIYERAVYPDAEYAFQHPLTHEVAYRTQLAEARARLHAAAARTIVELYADKLDEHAALIAQHWEGAGDILEAARWMRRAAEWVAASDLVEAQRRWRELRTLADTLPETPETRALGIVACTRILNLGIRLGMTAEEADAVFTHARGLAERSGDQTALGRLLTNYGMVRGSAGDMDAAMQRIAEATRLAQESNDLPLQVGVLVTMVIWKLHRGDLKDARALVERVLELTHDTPDAGNDMVGFSPFIFGTFYRGVIRLTAGDLAGARQDFDRSVELAQVAGDSEVVAMVLGFYAVLAWFSGDATIGLAEARHAVELAETIGSPMVRAQAYGFLGITHVHREEWTAAVAALQNELAIAREHHTLRFVEAGTLAMLARAYMGRGELDVARTTADQAVAVGHQRGSRVFECDAHLTRASVRLRSEGVAARLAVETELATAERLIAETGARSRLPFVHLYRADLARASGDAAWRERELRAALRDFTANGATAHAARVTRWLEAEAAAAVTR